MATAIERMQGGLSAGTAKALGGGYASVAAAGSTQGTATAIVSSRVLVGSADGAKGVILPAGEPGDEITLINNSSSTLLVYPQTGAAITVPGTGLGSANTAYSQVTYAVATYTMLTSTQWCVVTSAGFSGTTASFTTVTADAIVGGDASLGITGLASGTGGAVVVTGGTSSTATTIGGATTVKGGTGNTSGAGGPVNITGGIAGSTGVGGAVNITGGVPTDNVGGAVVIAGAAGVGTNRAGGLASVTGGAGTGTGIGGVASVVGGAGGVGGATGKGGAAIVTGGASSATNADGGGVVLGGGAKNGTAFVGPIVLGNAQLTPIYYPQAAPAADAGDTSPTVTVAQMVAGLVSGTPTQARTFTLPTGAEMDLGVAFADVPATFGFDFTVQNRAAFAATDDIITVAAGASGMTVTGSAVVSPGSAGRFRAVRAAADTWIVYKIAG